MPLEPPVPQTSDAVYGTAPIFVVDPVIIPSDAEGRSLLVRVTAPISPDGPLPVILFSHGSMLSRQHYPALTEWWARAGFIVLQPDHEDAAIDGFAPPGPPPVDVWRTRILDMRRVCRALDKIEDAVPGLRGCLDRKTVLAAGHSFGGHTVAAMAGARVWNERTGQFESFFDPAVKGAIAMSPPGSGGADLSTAWRARGGFFTVDWEAFRCPVLVIVGSRDDSKQMTVREADWHADMFHRSSAPDMCLLTLIGAGHYLGGIVDPRRIGMDDADPRRLAAVRGASVGFLRDVMAGRKPRIADAVCGETPFEIQAR
jgi:dienelactone hydrolase